MIFNQDFKLKHSLPTWFWAGIFLISISGTFYLGINPNFIDQWWLVLVSYNVIMGLVASSYIIINIKQLKRNTEGGIIGSRFTWSFIKIVPILVIVPVLSFYLFSFQTIQENVKNSEKTFAAFNTNFIEQVDGLYQGVQKVRDNRYTQRTQNLLNVIVSYSDFIKNSVTYKEDMKTFIEGLVDKNWACQIILTNFRGKTVAKTLDTTNCKVSKDVELLGVSPNTNDEGKTTNIVRVKMSSDYVSTKDLERSLVVSATYATDPSLLSFLKQVKVFSDKTKQIQFYADTTITQKRFLIDFSSTVLLAILSALMIVFRMMEHLMRPLHNLSLATNEITKGNYDVSVYNQKENKDIYKLIASFNQMSKQIKFSREGLDTHNLYLETILKYSYGVIGLDKEKKIRLINPIIGKMLEIEDEQIFIGKLCNDISVLHPNLEPLFSSATENFKQFSREWSEEIKAPLSNKDVLLSCQGATLDVGNKTLGYVIIIKDISKLHSAQKKAAWGEVAQRMAHEIKNPLTPILLSAQRLRNKFLKTLKGKDLEVIDKTTNTIISQVKSMDTMVTAFADYANAPQVNKKSYDLNILIKRTIELYEAQNNIDIKLDLSTDIPKLLLDTDGISRVLINLIKNSVEAADNKDNLKINISSKYIKSKNIVRLNIKDNGKGFNKDIIGKVFEPYISTKHKGSGLGMAIVQDIIEQHNGQVFVSNIKPHGAKITIDFDYKTEL